MKKYFALMLVLALVLSVSVYSFADLASPTNLSPNQNDVGPIVVPNLPADNGGDAPADNGGNPAANNVAAVPVPAPKAEEEAPVVEGTKADGTVVKADAAEVIKDADTAVAELKESNPDKAEELTAFFAEAQQAEDTVTFGVIDLDGKFEDVADETVSVPVAAPGVVKGQTVKVTLSDGTVIEVVCQKDGVVYIPVSKNAENIGYVISEV